MKPVSFNVAWKPFAIPLILIILAELVARAQGGTSLSLAPPSEIASAGMQALLDRSLLTATYQTLASVLGGFVIGSVAGVGIGIMLSLQRHLDATTQPAFEIARAMPPVAVIPTWLIIFGLGYQMEIAIIAFSILWPNIVMTKAAVRAVEPRLMEVARVLGLSYTQQVLKIVLPAALPRIFVALRITLGFALILAVTIEIVANPQGLGSAIMLAREAASPGRMLAFLIWIGAVGVVLNAVMTALHFRFFGHFEQA